MKNEGNVAYLNHIRGALRMILQNNSGKLKSVKETEFKLEKDIQILVENNMTMLLEIFHILQKKIYMQRCS